MAFGYLDNIGPIRFNRIISCFGSAQKAWKASDQDWRRLGWGKIAEDFFSLKRKIDPDRCLKKLVASYCPPIWPIIKLDSYYPKNLLAIDDAPAVLYSRGNSVTDLVNRRLESWQSFWSSEALAVVGTRRATAYGRQITVRLSENLAQNGLIIVSGLARGIDTLAHQSALSVGGKTVAVLGSGVDVVYPAQNRQLYQKILSRGIIFSELVPGTKPLPGHFPARNRIISGLSLGVLVVEGGIKSGSLITASLAANQGREVLAIPGNITSQLSSGANYLIKNGAKMVTEVADVLEEFNLAPRKGSYIIGLDDEEKSVADLLAVQNMTIDEIVCQSGLETNRISIILTKLEIKGIAVNLGLGQWGMK
ncbi:MAG: DNA-processing protein DprA [Candidatus Shapirobacteria bacterium]|nr:DNA-processing protein DprA [Candidatus Shapirobacteria bacterium]